MRFNVDNFKIDFYQPNKDESYEEILITYGGEEANIFFDKIGLKKMFSDVVKKHNGEYLSNDCFETEEDALAAIDELKTIMSNDDFSETKISNAVHKYIHQNNLNIYNDKDFSTLRKYFFMLDKNYIKFILNIH